MIKKIAIRFTILFPASIFATILGSTIGEWMFEDNWITFKPFWEFIKQ